MTGHDDKKARQSHNSADTEKAQAKRFAKILRGELASMNEKVVAAEVEWLLDASPKATSIHRNVS